MIHIITVLEKLGFTVNRHVTMGVYYLTRGDLTATVLADQNKLVSVHSGDGEDSVDVTEDFIKAEMEATNV